MKNRLVSVGLLAIAAFISGCSLSDSSKDSFPVNKKGSSVSMMEISLAGAFLFTLDPDNSGILKSYHAPSCKDSSWSEIHAPGSWESQGVRRPKTSETDDSDPYVGYAWYRKWIDVPPEWEGEDLELELGLIADAYVCFWNGEKIGERSEPSYNNTITIPDNLTRRNRKNLLAIQARDKWGEGGIVEGPLILRKARSPWKNLDVEITSETGCLAFDKDSPIVLNLEITNPLNAPLDIQMNISIRDFDDKMIYEEAADMRLNHHKATRLSLNIPPMDQGHYRCQFDVYVKRSRLKTFESAFSIIGDAPFTEYPERSPFGLSGYASVFSEKERFETLGNPELRLQRLAGVSWIRAFFLWEEIEPEDREWDFARIDRVLESCELYDIFPMANLSGRPAWIAESRPGSVDHVRRFAQYAGLMASRYRNRVRYWEILQAPDSYGYRGIAPDAESYVRLLKASWEAIRQSDKEACVIGMASRITDMEFIEQALRLGAGEYMDIISLHIHHSGFPSIETLESDLEKIREVRTILDRYGSNAPIWITECGLGGKGSVSERLQAENLVKFHVMVLADGIVERVFWKNLVDGFDIWRRRKVNFGLFHDDYVPKPSFSAYHTMVRTLRDFTGIRRLDLPKGLFGYEAQFGNRKKVRILWSEGETRFVGIHPDSQIIDLSGKTRKETGGEIAIGGAPRYILGEWE